jgi:cysteine desulfurase / selenocysteine lyase
MNPAALQAQRARVVGIDARVPLIDGRLVAELNLDNAASTPALREVLDAVIAFMPWYASVHRGAGYKSRYATRAFEEARATLAAFVGADPRDHVVIFGKNTTEAINKLAHRIAWRHGDVVLVSMLEHHSNDLPWRLRACVRHIDVDAQGALDEGHFEHLLAHHSGRVRLVAVTGASNVTGQMPRIHHLAERAHAAGARIAVDAAQLAPHRAIDMRPLDDPGHIDYLALSAHKLYAPFGCGALIGRRDTFERGAPDCRGGGTVRFVSLDRVAWAGAPERDEAGSPNVVGAVALAAALRALADVGFDTIAAHEASLVAHALRSLADVPSLRLYGDAHPEGAALRTGVIPFNLDGLPHALVAAMLSGEHGIGVRSGCFCAHPYVTRLLRLSTRDAAAARRRLLADDHRDAPGLVRISFGLYNTVSNVDRLVQALHAIARGEAVGRYRWDAAVGEWATDQHPPVSDPVPGIRLVRQQSHDLLG